LTQEENLKKKKRREKIKKRKNNNYKLGIYKDGISSNSMSFIQI